jgi:hypothetical protein
MNPPKMDKWFHIGNHHYIHQPKLGMGVLSLSKVNPSTGARSKLASMPNHRISENFRTALLETLKNQKVADLSDLDQAERDYIYSILNVALPEEVLQNLTKKQRERVEDVRKAVKAKVKESNVRSQMLPKLERLELLVGEAMAGNHNNLLLQKESIGIVNALVKHGIISQAQGVAILEKTR